MESTIWVRVCVCRHPERAKVPKYSTIINLDRNVPNMELPKYAQRAPLKNIGLAEVMKHYMLLNYCNYGVLHRVSRPHAD